MPEELDRPPGGGSIVTRVAIGAVVLLVALTVIGWIVGAVLAILRTILIVVALVAIAAVVLRGVGRD